VPIGHPGGTLSGLAVSGFTSRGLRLASSTQPTAPRARPVSARRLVKDSCFHEPGRLPSTSAPSTRPSRNALTNCSVNAPRSHRASTGARHRSRSFAAASRLPTLVRPSLAEGGRARPAAVRRNGPSAARRLLQPKHSASTTARSPEPRFRRLGDCALRARFSSLSGAPFREGRIRCCNPSSSTCSLVALGAPLEQGLERAKTAFAGLASFGWRPPLREGPSRGFTGQGPGGFRPPGALRRDCSRRKLRPDPIRSSTSCRELAAMTAGVAVAANTCARKRTCPSRTRRTSPLSLGSPNDPLSRSHPPMAVRPEPSQQPLSRSSPVG
jgi:hypothetical protein